MDDLFSVNTFGYLVAFLVPGLIARWTWKNVVVSATADQKTEALSSIIASAWLYALISPAIYGAYLSRLQSTSPKVFGLALFAALFVWPVIAGFVAAKVMTSRTWKKLMSGIGVRRPEPRAWDTFFAGRESCFVRVKFQNGGVLGGLFHERSAVSCFPAAEDLFVEATYHLDPVTKQFLEPVPQTMGAWIDMKTVKYVEFFRIRTKEPRHDDETG